MTTDFKTVVRDLENKQRCLIWKKHELEVKRRQNGRQGFSRPRSAAKISPKGIYTMMTQNEIDIVTVLEELVSRKSLQDSIAAMKRLIHARFLSQSPEARAAAEAEQQREQRMKERRETLLAPPKPRPGLTQEMINRGMVMPPSSEEELARQEEYKRLEEDRKQRLALLKPRPGLTQEMISKGMVMPLPSADEIARQEEYKRLEEERKQRASQPSVPR